MATGMATGDTDTIILQATQRLGYPSLRENQYKAVFSFLNGNDVFVILPTGSGKSLCFAVLRFAFDALHGRVGSIVIVISPLTLCQLNVFRPCRMRVCTLPTRV